MSTAIPEQQPTAGILLREEPSGDPAADLDRGIELLREVAQGKRGPLLRIYRPAPTLAFGQRDTRAPGYEAAAQAGRDAGFAPLIRKAGGRAMAYHPGSWVIDHIQPEKDAMLTHQHRFEHFANLFVEVFTRLGIPSAVGELPGEYCPGEYSVHGIATGHGRFGRGRKVKLVGTAQRVVQGAWLFSSAVILEDTDPIAAVTESVYEAMGLELDPNTIGSVQDLVAESITHEHFIETLLEVWGEHGYTFDERG
ncbi:lipoate--protein ligase family protein [Pseudoglutamicibacter albus]|uniref:lipoate--protein ligase family protein n=1 Tax=Pseudoglutamicibacter albus TaxID=98671 RepID=UPI000A5089CF|nr:lipoate--protein ligase family protein [Pseudoglutamicibacter albus]MCG7304258.1 lipoate--protein ligase family protein [Pseudoglutamicibacter albus]